MEFTCYRIFCVNRADERERLAERRNLYFGSTSSYQRIWIKVEREISSFNYTRYDKNIPPPPPELDKEARLIKYAISKKSSREGVIRRGWEQGQQIALNFTHAESDTNFSELPSFHILVWLRRTNNSSCDALKNLNPCNTSSIRDLIPTINKFV